jgi:hypothetical protein
MCFTICHDLFSVLTALLNLSLSQSLKLIFLIIDIVWLIITYLIIDYAGIISEYYMIEKEGLKFRVNIALALHHLVIMVISLLRNKLSKTTNEVYNI